MASQGFFYINSAVSHENNISASLLQLVLYKGRNRLVL
jgi:hypothetical protein